jgi:predicted secreted hydrolase
MKRRISDGLLPMTDVYRLPAAFALVIVMLSGCAVADDPADERAIRESEERPAARLLEERFDPQPVDLPDDAAPHDRLTEWWYYTGHVQDRDDYLYGFQFVIFQVLRGEFPPTYAAHFAVTDTRAGEFAYAERVETFQYEPGDYPVDLTIGDWQLRGGDGSDTIIASMEGYELEVHLNAEKDPVLHEGDGFFEFAPGQESYYYSRTRMSAEGVLTVDGEPRRVTGEAWFDQQWGDFLVLDNVGWDWFSMQLDNDKELMAWQSHDRQGSSLDANATIVMEDGSVVDIPAADLRIEAVDQWQSPATGGIYPMGWLIEIPDRNIQLEVEPVMEDQELITLESTGVIYWEGMVTIAGRWEGESVRGLGYVELTRYASIENDQVLFGQRN